MMVDQPLTPREAALIAAMSARPSATQEELAAELQITSRYVRKLLARERVRKALDASARAGLASASTSLGRGAQRAAEALLAMASGSARATTPRVAACKAVLNQAACAAVGD
jgi:DNA-binding CsgD family transcriptional regulator